MPDADRNPPTSGEAVEWPPNGAAATGLLLAAILTISGLAMSVNLGTGGARSWHESVSIRTAHETWVRSHRGVEGAWFVPFFEGRPRAAKPPLAAWLAILSWTDLSPRTADVAQIVPRCSRPQFAGAQRAVRHAICFSLPDAPRITHAEAARAAGIATRVQRGDVGSKTGFHELARRAIEGSSRRSDHIAHRVQHGGR